MTLNVNVMIQGICAVRSDVDAGVFVSWAPGLDIYSQGMTEEEAIRALDDAVTLFVNRCGELGILDEQMRAAGFKKIAPTSFRESIAQDRLLEKSGFARFAPTLSVLNQQVAV